MKIRRSAFTYLELSVVLFVVALGATLAFPVAVRMQAGRARRACASNLKQIGVVLKMWANENHELFPPLSPVPHNWMLDMDAVYPDYLSDIGMLICPGSPFAATQTFRLIDTWDHPDGERGAYHPDCVSSLFYIYTGYLIQSDEQAFALFDAANRRPWEAIRSGDFELQVPVWADRPAGDAEARTGAPVLWDRVPLMADEFAHRPLGGNVLHMDGHVRFVRYNRLNPSKYFPITRVSAETFGSVLPQLSCDCP